MRQEKPETETEEDYKTKGTSRTPCRRQCTRQRPHIQSISA